MTGALYMKGEDMVFRQIHSEAGGSATVCQLVGPEMSKTIDAGVATYDGCSIERKVNYDEAAVVLGGTFRILTGENYDRVIEAKFGDVIWLTKGTRLKYQGDKATVFYARHPVDWQTRSKAVEDEKTLTDVYHFRSTDMIYSQIQIYSGGYASTCSLVTPEISKSLGATIATYNSSSVDWTTEYDQISVALGGLMRIRTGENYSQAIDARLGDVVWLPKGTPLKYEGERGIMFFVPYPVDWRLRSQPVRPKPWPASVR
ncbi:ethanolamine utilization protein EutQ (cupin superfamily) [Bradyrhizobium sp. LM2.7]